MAGTEISLVRSLYEVFHVPCHKFELQVPVVNCRAPSSPPLCLPDGTLVPARCGNFAGANHLAFFIQD